MGDQMLRNFFKNKSMAYFFNAFWFIDKALKIAVVGMFSLHVFEIDATARNLLPFPLTSKILVTARNLNETDIFGHSDGIQVCSHRVELLKAPLMDERENTLLFGYASLDWKPNFDLLDAKSNIHPLNYLEWLLHICEGIPCILKIGWYELRRRGNTVSALREIVEEIQDLKELEGGGHLPQLMVDIVYRQLGKPSQDAFLDIASYFYDWERRKVSDIVGEMELGDLEGAGLVTTSKEGKVKMTDIVRARGRNLSEGNRITYWESLRFVVRDPQKLEKIKGIWLPHGDFHIKTYDVHLMQSLRVLYLGCCTKLHGPWMWNFEHLRFLCISYEDILPKGQKLGKLLSKLSWLGFLVVCLTEQRLESNQAISINLPESLQLRCLEVYVPESLPLRYDSDFLPSLRIKGRFSSLGESLGSFSCLKILELNDCSELKRLPENIGNLSSLKILELNYCSDLERLSENFGNLSSLLVLNIRNCSKLERLPENIGNLSSLQRLDMSYCSKMEILPEKLGNLSSLLHLDMSNCSKLERLPDNIGNLSSLLHLDMSNCSKLETLPENIGNLSSLRHLNMSHCTMLFTFPHSFADIVVRRKCALFLPPHFLPSNA